MLTREQLKAVRKIQIRTSHLVSDLFAGQYQSVFKGRGMEFSEVRLYEPGDEIRTIDWNVTARAGVPFVKRYAEEREPAEERARRRARRGARLLRDHQQRQGRPRDLHRSHRARGAAAQGHAPR